jgi:probable rRNA maturation factor
MVCHPAERQLPAGALDALGRLAEQVLAVHPLDGGRVQAVFTTDDHMAHMNEQFRGKAMTTDVLSFDYGQPEGAETESLQHEWTRGEIFISVERAAEQAKDRGIAPTCEIARLLVHGLLHLSGYDHQTDQELQEMESLTDSFIEASGFSEAQ